MVRPTGTATARAWVEVDLGALSRNGATLRARAGVPLLPMVKADAYGLSAVAVARALQPLHPWGFGVATVDEAAELRDAGIRQPIVLFTPALPDEFARIRSLDVRPVLGDPGAIAAWTRAGGAWHLGIDTGMSRAGARWDRLGALAADLERCPPEGAATHFHSAELDDGSRAAQERRFWSAIDSLARRPVVLHAENSAAIARIDGSRFTVVRPGVFLYGVGSGAAVVPEPVVNLRARIVEIRDVDAGESVSYGATYRAAQSRRIATLAIGYGDGYRRVLGNRGTVLVAGRRAPVVGVVTMDMTMIDVTNIDCEVGDVATLIGRDGNELLTVEEVAHAGDLSPYELITGLSIRAPRVHIDAPDERGPA